MAERRTPNPDAGGSSPSWPARLIDRLGMEIEKIALPQQVTRFFKEVRAELKKVTWTGRKEVMSGTIAVLVLSGIISVFLWFIDLGLSQAVRLVLGLG
jgi:preprotein translocase subunit SecE